jgi:hypothetical protein
MLLPEALSRRVIEMQEQEGVRVPELTSSKIPDSLRELLPYAQILGVGDDGVRGNIAELLLRELSDADADALIDIVTRRHKELSEWFDSEKSPHSDEWSALWCLDDLVADILDRRDAAGW